MCCCRIPNNLATNSKGLSQSRLTFIVVRLALCWHSGETISQWLRFVPAVLLFTRKSSRPHPPIRSITDIYRAINLVSVKYYGETEYWLYVHHNNPSRLFTKMNFLSATGNKSYHAQTLTVPRTYLAHRWFLSLLFSALHSSQWLEEIQNMRPTALDIGKIL